MNDSLSPAVGNIYKGGDSFINNFGTNNTFVGENAGNFTMTGSANAGFGSVVLQNNTTGARNSAFGYSALTANLMGGDNVAVGFNALLLNTVSQMTAVGSGALQNNTTGTQNAALGYQALNTNTVGNGNVAVGPSALSTNTTGSNNIAIGIFSGSLLTTGNNNIDIGHIGVAAESGTIRIGTGGTHLRNFQAGIRGVTTGAPDAIPVVIDSAGQLGTMSSSIRYKENVEDMNDESSPILDLRPVTFNYKADTTKTKQFGLIAEEVNKVLPALVVRGADGQIETVKYHELASLLLNEVIKQHMIIEKQSSIMEEQNNELKELRKEVDICLAALQIQA